MAQYMILIYGDENAWSQRSEEEANAAMGKWFAYTEELEQSGSYVAGDALQPTPTAKSVHFGGRAGEITDGPFAETKEQLGGYYIVDAETEAEAIDWARKLPMQGGTAEVRPVVVFPKTADASA